MSTANWEKFGEEIRKTVHDAVENQDFAKLNQAISDTVIQAADAVAQNVKNVKNVNHTKSAAGSVQSGYHACKSYSTQTGGRMQQPKEGAGIRYTNVVGRPFGIKAPSMTGAVLSMVFGYALGAVEVLWISMLLAVTFLPDLLFGIGPRIISGVLGALAVPLAVLGFWLAVSGTIRFGRIRRFREYVETIGQREYCNLSELEARVGKSERTVVKDLEYMIRKRWFTQGHFDSRKQCLIVTDGMYAQYRQLETRKKLQREEEQRMAEKKQAEAVRSEELPKELREVMAAGEEYIRKLRVCNDEIPGEEISVKISRIETLTARIFERVRQNPASVDDIRKMMDYYLPTTVKLLEAYAQMDAQPAGGENIVTAKKEIEDTLDTLNTAFERLLDSLFRETAWDVSSDISVLNTMLAQEGLKEDGMKKSAEED